MFFPLLLLSKGKCRLANCVSLKKFHSLFSSLHFCLSLCSSVFRKISACLCFSFGKSDIFFTTFMLPMQEQLASYSSLVCVCVCLPSLRNQKKNSIENSKSKSIIMPFTFHLLISSTDLFSILRNIFKRQGKASRDQRIPNNEIKEKIQKFMKLVKIRNIRNKKRIMRSLMRMRRLVSAMLT